MASHLGVTTRIRPNASQVGFRGFLVWWKHIDAHNIGARDAAPDRWVRAVQLRVRQTLDAEQSLDGSRVGPGERSLRESDSSTLRREVKSSKGSRDRGHLKSHMQRKRNMVGRWIGNQAAKAREGGQTTSRRRQLASWREHLIRCRAVKDRALHIAGGGRYDRVAVRALRLFRRLGKGSKAQSQGEEG